jgi:hypothetical protein
MKTILIIVAVILFMVGVRCGEPATIPASRNPSPPHLLVIAYLVLLDHAVSFQPVSKNKVSTAAKPKTRPLVPRVFPARVGLW